MTLGNVERKGKVKVWDLEWAINGTGSSSKDPTRFVLPSPFNYHWEIIGDESQVFTFGGVTVTVILIKHLFK